MKRKKRKVLHLVDETQPIEQSEFLKNSAIIKFNSLHCTAFKPSSIEDIKLSNEAVVTWYNLDGFSFSSLVKKLIYQNKLDAFLINLTAETNHRNKAIQLSDCFFFTIKIPFVVPDNNIISFEQIIFIIGKDFIWSIQEIPGDNFDHIRSRLNQDVGIVRKKGADYLMYLLVESVIDEFYSVYEFMSNIHPEVEMSKNRKPSPELAEMVEQHKTQLYLLKKSALSLSDALNQANSIELDNFNTKYLYELREQIIFLNDEIDINLNHLESSLNLIFSLQNHQLNEIMKTLTLFSVIFIPLTFIAGIYGMNFSNMPELYYPNGYFILLAVLFCIGLAIYFTFRRKKWLD